MLLIYFAIQCIISLFRSSTAGLIRGFGVAVFSIPTGYIMTGLVWTVVQGVDQLTRGILNIGVEGDEGSPGVAGVASMSGAVCGRESVSVALDAHCVQCVQADNQR